MKYTYINEMPLGTKLKYSLDEKDKSILFIERTNQLQTPFNYGFLKDYIGEDKEGLDVFVVDIQESIYPKAHLDINIIGAYKLTDEKGETELKLLGTFEDNLTETDMGIIHQITQHFLKFCKGKEKAELRSLSEFIDKERTENILQKYRVM